MAVTTPAAIRDGSRDTVMDKYVKESIFGHDHRDGRRHGNDGVRTYSGQF